jgi:hypothetical protein
VSAVTDAVDKGVEWGLTAIPSAEVRFKLSTTTSSPACTHRRGYEATCSRPPSLKAEGDEGR